MEIIFTNSIEEFEKTDFVKINYSSSKLDSGIFFQSSTILFETGIKEQGINIFEYNNHKCFFRVSKDSEFPFDPFGASFYLISRYEEYLPHIKDQHERFLATESLAFQNDFLDQPLVNVWSNEIVKRIETHSPSFRFPEREFSFISTLDIDNAYAYKNKGFIRIIGGLGKALLKGNDFAQRIRVLFGKEEDPYDTFKYQHTIHQKYKVSPIYFFLLGDYGLNDKNTPIKNKSFRSLIKSVADYHKVGIHPSYGSNKNINTLTKEINRLQSITHKNIKRSRQHFLKLDLPYTYRNLIDNDIQSDYTMGFAEKNGFRASISSPYYFYDLDLELETKLQLFPFAAMEATCQYYQKFSPENASQEIVHLMKKVREVKGTFISVWHNESLSNQGIWKGWRKVYEKMLKESTNKN